MPRPTLGALYAARLSRLADGLAYPFVVIGRALNRWLGALTCDHAWRYSKSRGRTVCRYCRATRGL